MGEKVPAVPGGVRMTLGSLFDGSGGFPLAGSMCGIEPVWASEIEAYPIRVTAKNFPHMKHLGDIRKISGKEIILSNYLIDTNMNAIAAGLNKTIAVRSLCVAFGFFLAAMLIGMLSFQKRDIK